MDDERIVFLQAEITRLENMVFEKKQELALLQIQTETVSDTVTGINNYSRPAIKIALFRSLFHGREDVFAKRFESKKNREVRLSTGVLE